MEQPAWLAHAWGELGQRELPGSRDNPRILQLYRDVGFADVRHDEVAWCAAFVGACLERAGVASTRLLLARSYLAHGKALEAGRPGAVVVLSRGADPALGHVGFWLGETATHLYLLGGNQGDAVTVQGFDRSRLLAIRWPLAVEDGAGPSAPRHDGFAAALAHVLEMEGGYSHDPYDPGGPTNKGITLATLAAWRGEPLTAQSHARLLAALKSIDADSVARIYRERYWLASLADRLPAALAIMHFDAAVNHGVGGAARMLQEALGVEVDGEIGPVTLAAAARARTAAAISAYADIRRRRYRGLAHFWRFGRGWLRRVEATERLALAQPRPAPHPSATTPTGEHDMTTTTTGDSAATHAEQSKWWGESMTIWGVIITTLATVLPVIGPLVGLDISGEMVRQIGAQATQVLQAIGGLAGTLMTVYGRMRAVTPLSRRELRIRL